VVVLWILVIAAIVFGVALLALGRGDSLVPATADRVEPDLPDRPLRPADVDGLRLPQALRGYRMTEVDAVLARLRDELAARDAELSRLRDDEATSGVRLAEAASEPAVDGSVSAVDLPADPGA
jgi:DivIVA domain-containing protein